MIVRPVNKDDFASIAAIHKAAYSLEHLTAFFPPALLEVYYRSIWQLNPFAFIAINDQGQPAGFVIGGDKLGEPIDKFIKQYQGELIKIFLTHPQFIFLKIADRLRQMFQRKQSAIPFQLLSIAVRSDIPAPSCGRLLMAAFENSLRENGIKQYGLSVKKTNKRAMGFYEKNNFKLEFETVSLKCYYKNLNQLNS